MSGRLLEGLDSLQNLLIAVAAVALVWLLLRKLGVGVQITKAGFGSPFVWTKETSGLPGWERAMAQ
jgi:hypothetical protein